MAKSKKPVSKKKAVVKKPVAKKETKKKVEKQKAEITIKAGPVQVAYVPRRIDKIPPPEVYLKKQNG
jgi:hypothetical protein